MKIKGNPQLDPAAFTLTAGPVGCLLLHGFTGSPPEMRLLAEYLHGRGITVSAPLLAGHGTNAADLTHMRWQDWAASVEHAWAALRQTCPVTFVGGLSLGSLLACHLAAQHPEVAGLIAFSPAIRVANPWLGLAGVLRLLVKQWPKGDHEDLTEPNARQRTWHYATYPTNGLHQVTRLQRVVRRELRRTRVPALVVYSTLDSAIHPTAGQYLFNNLASEKKELVTLHNSGHILTVDSERESIFARTYGFIVAHAGGRGA
jgi:carboxylesterase